MNLQKKVDELDEAIVELLFSVTEVPMHKRKEKLSELIEQLEPVFSFVHYYKNTKDTLVEELISLRKS